MDRSKENLPLKGSQPTNTAPSKELTPEEFRKLTAQEKAQVIAEEMVRNLNNPANHGKSI